MNVTWFVDSFPPIGDLCYPSSARSGKFQVTTKVTPAYPGKIKCAPPIPYEVCVQVLNGQIDEAGLRKLGFATNGRLGEYISRDGVATRTGGFGSYGSAYAGSSAWNGYGGLVGYAGANAAASSIGHSTSRTSSVAMSSDVQTVRGSSRRPSCESNDFGDEQGTSLLI